MQINYYKLLYTCTKRRPNDDPFDDSKSSIFCTIFKGSFKPIFWVSNWCQLKT